MVLPLAAALAVTLLSGPKTSGAYVDARVAECIARGACGSGDMLAPSATFTGDQLTADWVQDSLTVAWRAGAAGLEVRGKGEAGWRRLVWEERADGTVWTDALLRDEPESLRWIPQPLEVYARRWDETWTRAQLARHAGRWGEGKAAVEVGPAGITWGGALHRVRAGPCQARCEGERLDLCFLEVERGRPVAILVARDGALEPATYVMEMCLTSVGPTVAFEPGGTRLVRSAEASPAKAPEGISAEVATRFLKAKLARAGCAPVAPHLTAKVSLIIGGAGLPTEVTVAGLPEPVAECVRGGLWGLTVPPAPLGAPPMRLTLAVDLSSP